MSEKSPVLHEQNDPVIEVNTGERVKINTAAREFCPQCKSGELVYDGCLNLSCPVCGFTQTGGGFT